MYWFKANNLLTKRGGEGPEVKVVIKAPNREPLCVCVVSLQEEESRWWQQIYLPRKVENRKRVDN